MEGEGLRQRTSAPDQKQEQKPGHLIADGQHPAGPKKHGLAGEVLRALLLTLYFYIGAVAIHATQILGSPLYFINRDYYYAWMAMTKQHFGVQLTTMSQFWAPVTFRISGDKSVRGQIRLREDGMLECDFPERIVLIANHQIYTDWIYLWWIAYTNRMHGHIYIILKESLKWIPIVGTGMMFYSFVFLSRKWETDRPRFAHRLQKLKARHHGPMSGSDDLDPMWLLIFPEGTNLSKNGRAKSQNWSEKSGIPDLRHLLLPRKTGLMFCLDELGDTVEWIYDCTVSYEGVPRGEFPQDIFTMRSTYFQGRRPKSVNMHWRRFAVKDIPINDPDAFDTWLLDRWKEKDEMLEQYLQTGRFPADDGEDESPNGATKSIKGAGYIETSIRAKYPFEFLQLYVPIGLVWLILRLVRQLWHVALVTTGIRDK